MRGELPLQVAAKDDFFAKARSGADAEPDEQFSCRAGNEESQFAPHVVQSSGLIQVHKLAAGRQGPRPRPARMLRP